MTTLSYTLRAQNASLPRNDCRGKLSWRMISTSGDKTNSLWQTVADLRGITHFICSLPISLLPCFIPLVKVLDKRAALWIYFKVGGGGGKIQEPRCLNNGEIYKTRSAGKAMHSERH